MHIIILRYHVADLHYFSHCLVCNSPSRVLRCTVTETPVDTFQHTFFTKKQPAIGGSFLTSRLLLPRSRRTGDLQHVDPADAIFPGPSTRHGWVCSELQRLIRQRHRANRKPHRQSRNATFRGKLQRQRSPRSWSFRERRVGASNHVWLHAGGV